MAQDDLIRTPNTSGGALVHTKDIKDFKVPEGQPDIRGWDVRTADGTKLGKVADLLVDTGASRVRYLEIAVDKDVAKGTGRDYALIPVGTARLDDEHDDVIVNFSSTDLAGAPAYDRNRFSRDYETSLRSFVRTRSRTDSTADRAAVAGAATTSDRDVDFYASPEYDDRTFFGTRRRGRESGAEDRATSSGLGDRIADKIDNVKDRFDGNPASRPGPDATDRRI
jgi:photosynthetic reaction center H subunit